MDSKHFVHYCYALCGGNIGHAHHAMVSRLFNEEKLAKILVHRHQNPIFGSRPPKKNAIARVRSSFPRFDDVMTAFPQMCCQAPARAAIN